MIVRDTTTKTPIRINPPWLEGTAPLMEIEIGLIAYENGGWLFL
jgi:hypothetical protein